MVKPSTSFLKELAKEKVNWFYKSRKAMTLLPSLRFTSI